MLKINCRKLPYCTQKRKLFTHSVSSRYDAQNNLKAFSKAARYCCRDRWNCWYYWLLIEKIISLFGEGSPPFAVKPSLLLLPLFRKNVIILIVFIIVGKIMVEIRPLFFDVAGEVSDYFYRSWPLFSKINCWYSSHALSKIKIGNLTIIFFRN